MVNVSWFVVFFVTWPRVTATFDWNPEVDIKNLSEAALLIARDHLSKSTSTLVITEDSFYPEAVNINIRLLNHLLVNLNENVAVQRKHVGNMDTYDYNIFIVDSSDAFFDSTLFMYTRFRNMPLHFLIILTTYPEGYSFNVMQRIFKMCYELNVIDVVIIINLPYTGVCMYTYKLNSCRIPFPEIIFCFNEGLKKLPTVFPQKSNLYGCPLRVAADILSPMLIFNGNVKAPKPVGHWENLSGFEGMLLKILAERLNFQIKLLPWSETYTKYDTLHPLYKGDADVAIGGFGASNDIDWLSKSRVYHQAPYVFVIRARQIVSSLSRLVTPFNYCLWILILIVLISGIVAIKLFKCMSLRIRRFVFGDRNDFPYLNFNAVFLGYSIPLTPRRNFARFILMQWIIFTLVVRNAYQGSLYDAIRMNKFVKLPSGLDDLKNWNYTISLPKELTFGLFPKNEVNFVEAGRDVERFKLLEGINANFATVALREVFVHYMNRAHKNGSNLIQIDQMVYMEKFVMYFTRRSIYVDMFDKKLQALAYSGIMQHFASRFEAPSSAYSKNSQNSAVEALTNERLNAVYMIYIGMIVSAVIVFGIERLSIYSTKLRTILEWLN